ncbi:hypothetical protein Tco_0750677 [Tanacetum coccineum]|uniref:Uncharacterized protein n=1 Tax=Tanacetum coccineum TaxID=301880 RepID=A0ABQ4Z4J4_9ASTR
MDRIPSRWAFAVLYRKIRCAKGVGGRMLLLVDYALFPWDFAFLILRVIAEGMSVHPHPRVVIYGGSGNLLNENRHPINAYSEAFLCHMGISRNYFQSPEEVPTFIGDDGQGGCLSFLLPRLVVPKLRDRTVLSPSREIFEEPLLETQGVPWCPLWGPPRLDATSVGSSEDADVAGAESEAGEVDSRKPPDAPRHHAAAKEVTEYSTPRCRATIYSLWSADLDMVTGSKPALVGAAESKVFYERSQSVQKMKSSAAEDPHGQMASWLDCRVFRGLMPKSLAE